MIVPVSLIESSVIKMNVKISKRHRINLAALVEEIFSDECQYSKHLFSSEDYTATKSVENNKNFTYQINKAAEAKSKTQEKTVTKTSYNDDDNNNNNVLIDDKTKTETQVNNGCSPGQ